MPPPSSRMTKNQVRNIRYRPGKAEADQAPDFESESEEDDIGKTIAPPARRPAPAASTFPARRKLPPSRPAPVKQPDVDLEGFVTASESSEGEEFPAANGTSESGSEEDDSSDEDDDEEEESESEAEQKPRLIAPTFMSKAQRQRLQAAEQSQDGEQAAAEEARRRQEKADELLQAHIEKDKALRAAGKKAWDDDDIPADDVDDTDGLDPEAEQAAWKLRELKRVRRDRLALVAKEQEREEIERRKNLTAEEREAEDRDLLEQQKAEQEGRGKMAYMQKYFHKGAFFKGDDEEQDEEVKAALSRDLAGARFVDETNKDTLPEYMRIRDMALLGRKGRTKYKDLKSEDTGRFGDFGHRKQTYDGVDERFRPEHDNFRDEQKTGANAAPVGTRRRREDDDQQQNNDKRSRYL